MASARRHPDAPAWWNTDKWATPSPFVRQLEDGLGLTFTLDACASPRNHKAPRYYTQRDDGLRQPWDAITFWNPPYSDPAPWAQKAMREMQRGRCPVSVGLIPPAVGTHWFHDYVLPHAELHFVRGRIAFLDWNDEPTNSNRGESLVVVYRAHDRNAGSIVTYHNIVFDAASKGY